MSSPSKQRRRGGRKRLKCEIPDNGNTSSSAVKIGTSVDLLTLILTRLPSKVLLVFKLVSKFWLSIIHSPHFAHEYFIRNPSLSILGLFWGTELPSVTKHKYEYIFLDGNTDGYVPFETIAFKVKRLVRVGIKILQSCNGLLLCGNVVSRNSDRTYYIFNPYAKQYKIIPPSQIRSRDFPYLMNVSLVSDPSKSPYYKVISFWSSRDISDWCNIDPELFNTRTDLSSTKFRVEIYDSETSTWGLSGFYSCTPAAECLLWGRGAGIFWNLRLYW
ncbi:F-box protein At5g07610-like [Papaver somniferum]|uniref:F-box protein At5g07610-like n=1 Tax=Papaver somniferum TaxID=3469 RepID=UPI000E6F7CA7|nr:F-box protein At5g07610-like [Papaver somniferum]